MRTPLERSMALKNLQTYAKSIVLLGDSQDLVKVCLDEIASSHREANGRVAGQAKPDEEETRG